MDNLAKIIIAAMIVVIIALCLVIIIVLKGEKKRTKNVIRSNNSESPVNTNKLQDRNEYEKTEALGVKYDRRIIDEYDAPVKIEEVPKLTNTEKTEVLLKVKKKDSPALEKTEIFIEKSTPHPKAVLKYMEKGEKKEYEICTDFINIGRDPEICHVVISDDNYLGKHHAIIFSINNNFFVVDVKTKNGTYIKSEKIEGSAGIPGSCKMRFAKTEMEFIIV